MLKFYLRDAKELRQSASELARDLKSTFHGCVEVEVEDTHAQIGSGSLPVHLLPSAAVVFKPVKVSLESLAAAFRSWRIPILGRIQDQRLYFDLRTARCEDIEEIRHAAQHVAQSVGNPPCVM